MTHKTSIHIIIFLSIILICFGAGVYGMFHLNQLKETANSDICEWIPDDCIGVFESDNMDFFTNELLRVQYASQLDTLRNMGFIKIILSDLVSFNFTKSHSFVGNLNHLVVSFHTNKNPRDIVAYFKVGEETKSYFYDVITRRHGVSFMPKKEEYRGEKIYIYPVDENNYVSVFGGDGVVVASLQKRLVEKVIDAKKDKNSLGQDKLFRSLYQNKQENFMTLYGRGPSVPSLSYGKSHYWTNYDINMNRDVFYLSGSTYECVPEGDIPCVECLDDIKSQSGEGFLIVNGNEAVDSCISTAIVKENPNQFDKVLSGLSRDAQCIMAFDMEKVASSPEKFKPYLPPVLYDYPWMLRHFIMSVQFSVVDGQLFHIFIFTYKH